MRYPSARLPSARFYYPCKFSTDDKSVVIFVVCPSPSGCDKKNVADILIVLRSYDELHGILILVKNSNVRLKVAISFCMKDM